MQIQSMAFRLSAMSLILAAASPALAFDLEDRAYFTLGAVQTTVKDLGDEEITLNPEAILEGENASTPQSIETFDVESDLVLLERIMNLGARVWAVVADNRPEVNAASLKASAVPEGITHWSQLSGWKAPRSKVVRMEYTNLYGMTVVDFSYRITYTYGGTYNSRGQFLTNVSIVPAHVFVAWGYQFNASAEVANIVNTLTPARPVAGMELGVSWKVDSILVSNQSTHSYFIKGTGELTDLSSGI